MSLRSVKRLLSETICFLLLTTTAFAQSDRGTITGTVTDPGRSVVAGATVTATNKATGIKQQTLTTETGNYTLTSLPAGLYDVTVEPSGFKKFISQGVQVQVAQTSRVDVPLELGAPFETVTVTAEASAQDRERGTEHEYQRRTFNSLPLNFGATNSIRSWLSFIQLAPGVSGKHIIRRASMARRQAPSRSIWKARTSPALTTRFGPARLRRHPLRRSASSRSRPTTLPLSSARCSAESSTSRPSPARTSFTAALMSTLPMKR